MKIQQFIAIYHKVIPILDINTKRNLLDTKKVCASIIVSLQAFSYNLSLYGANNSK